MNNLVPCWVDNSVVLMISTAHNPKEVIARNRPKPRLTDTNKRLVDIIWGTESTLMVEIPQIIDDYNKNIGGVDLEDQRIASYSGDLYYRRTWMPMMLECLLILRNNAFIEHRDLSNNSLTQK